jgi:hypothetical protein
VLYGCSLACEQHHCVTMKCPSCSVATLAVCTHAALSLAAPIYLQQASM